ncbi:MAG: hypothetical protein ACKOU6_07090, partial [Planctomycetota bacterium]
MNNQAVDWNFRIEIPVDERTELERALRATLDTAAHRIDPWVTGLAWSRLERYVDSPRRRYRMGVYGWLDGPFAGSPGPNEAGVLHTPSRDQTLTALILRDKFLDAERSGYQSSSSTIPWQMNVTSTKVRFAEELLEEVNRGISIQEVLGRRIEDVLGWGDVTHLHVKDLRTTRFPMNKDQRDPNEVCNGWEALGQLLKDPNDGLYSTNKPTKDSQVEALKGLQDAFDVLSDMLLAEGVLHIVRGNTVRGAKAMDAASGFDKLPNLEFVKTPASGFYIRTNVLSMVPFVPVSAIPDGGSPLRVIEPSLASFVDAKLGANWAWKVHPVDDASPASTVEIGIGQLGLSPVEALAYSDELLARWVLAIYRQRPDAAAATTAMSIEHPEVLQIARQMGAVLGSRLAMGRDVLQAEYSVEQRGRAAVELRERYLKTRALLAVMVKNLQEAMTKWIAVNPGSDWQPFRAIIMQAFQWGSVSTTLG